MPSVVSTPPLELDLCTVHAPGACLAQLCNLSVSYPGMSARFLGAALRTPFMLPSTSPAVVEPRLLLHADLLNWVLRCHPIHRW